MINEILKTWNEKRHETKVQDEYEVGLQKATEIFINQKKAIIDISNSEGYKIIRDWLEALKTESMSLVMQSNKNNIKAKSRYEVAHELLEYLDNLETINE